VDVEAASFQVTPTVTKKHKHKEGGNGSKRERQRRITGGVAFSALLGAEGKERNSGHLSVSR